MLSNDTKSMNTWSPLWNKIVDSSLWMEKYPVRILFVSMMALKDRDNVVRYNAFGLARRANITEEECLEALEVLSSPDKRRLEAQEFDGRRIKQVEGGWLILNSAKYREMLAANRREYKRVWAAEKKAKQRAEQEARGGISKPIRGATPCPEDDR